MKVLSGVKDYAVSEANFEALRLALDILGDTYSPAYFHELPELFFVWEASVPVPRPAPRR